MKDDRLNKIENLINNLLENKKIENKNEIINRENIHINYKNNNKYNNKQIYQDKDYVNNLIKEYKIKFREYTLTNFIKNKYRIEELGYECFTSTNFEHENEENNFFKREFI